MNKSGFTSLYIVIILTSLIFLVLVVIEAAAGYAVGSVAENLCMVSGESVLSEYQINLWKKYGVFALKSSDEKLTEMSRFYISESLKSDGNNLLSAELLSCDATSEKYPALDTEAFSAQIREMALLIVAEKVMNGQELSDSYDKTVDTFESIEPMKDTSLEDLQRLTAVSIPGESTETEEEQEEGSQLKEQAESLLRRYRSIEQEESAGSSLNRAVTDAAIKAILPSALMQIPQTRTLLFKRIVNDVMKLPENEYIIDRCSFATAQRKNTFLALEVEYILYGRFSDRENEKEIKKSLFWLRSAFNVSYIYSDRNKLAEVNAMAASVFSMIPLPLAVFMIASIWSGVEAQHDVKLLMAGDNVPFIKGESDWYYSLTGSVSGESVPLKTSSSESGNYDDYLRLFLLTSAREEKLIRLMDVMQLNIANIEGDAFSFRDYAYGFSLCAVFQKKMHLPGNGFQPDRNGTVKQEHAY